MILTVENATRVFEDENFREKEELIIPRCIDIISAGALKACKAKRVYIPSTVTYIGRFAFSSMKNLEVIYIPASVAKICSFAFANSNVKFINLSCRTYVNKDTFALCNKRVVITWRC